MRHTRAPRTALALVSVIALTLAAAGCAKEDEGSAWAASHEPTVDLPDLHGKKLQVAAVWTGAEQENFRKVLDEFEKRTGATVEFVPTGDNVATYIGSKIEGGAPPDVAMMPQVGVLRQFAEKGWLKPLGKEALAESEKNFGKGWRDLGSVDGKQYGIYYKAANKSLIWYNAQAFADAGVGEAEDWDAFVEDAQTLSDSGVDPVAIGGADGWVLTDWFENIYLSQAGPEKYDKLASHDIPWTDPSVTKALRTLAQLWGESHLLAGGNKGALQTAFPDSVSKPYGNLASPQAALVFEADFVGVNIATDTKARIGEDAQVYPFPKVGAQPPVVTGGDAAAVLKDSKGAQALATFLASKDAAGIWAAEDGFISPNKELDLSAYPNQPQREIAKALIGAGDDFRFDMSDQAPASFGGTKGEGEWKALQDFLAHPKDIKGTQRALEKAAAKAYEK
ncbi:ABC transporter substrate-binding protein [Streptomyces reniochalinae]|uniref:Carbohydrate ABC transporter substrate-binding protein n=1 Tax=Streptomyces reniochalinae TaxID=2250578 RepID=A0A367F2L1_9ACTN|nr:ABC transporter substrate-binding protein [Streptomyces reniochalinae]RCG24618.1 carbohydrate ABC transporter substrate-binding protein [Streptomyces reniochalinae]